MTNKALNDEDWGEPQRDERGRFVKGQTGNRWGRPRKKAAPPKSMAKCFAEGLAKEVSVNDNGIPQVMKYRELLVEAVLRGAMNSKPKEALHILERSECHAAEAAEEEVEEEYEEIFDEEDKRILEALTRNLGPPVCPQCAEPVPQGSKRRRKGDDGGFD